ncbi:MAG: hypothetical protein ACXAE3_05095 [Candidatus Kariarchaeaceae archaeon]|jgi:hypothetical protein
MDEELLDKTRTVLSKVDRVVEDLEDMIFLDGVFTEDEKYLVEDIKFTMNSYKRLVEDALADNIVTRKEYISLKAKELEVLRSAIRVAYRDGIITPEEDAILMRLEAHIKTLEVL